MRQLWTRNCGRKRLLHTENVVDTSSFEVTSIFSFMRPPVGTEEDLVARILAACEPVQNMPGIFDTLLQNMVQRCYASNNTNVHHYH